MLFSNKTPDTGRERLEDIPKKLLGISAITGLALLCCLILSVKYF